MPQVDVYEAFKELIGRLMSGDEEVAELAASDPEGLLAAYGVTDGDLAEVDFRQAVAESYDQYELPEGGRQALQSYVAGEPPPAHYEVKEPPAYTGGHQSAEQAAQHLQYVTYASYEGHEHVTQEIVNKQLTIDSSDNRSFTVDNDTDVAFDVAGDLDGAVIGDGNQAANLDIETGGGDGGDGGPLNLNFGAGDLATTEVDGGVSDAAVATGGDADNIAGNVEAPAELLAEAEAVPGEQAEPIAEEELAEQVAHAELAEEQLAQEELAQEAELVGQAAAQEEPAPEVEILPVGDPAILPADPAPVTGADRDEFLAAVPGA